jgi:hypothetical protein
VITGAAEVTVPGRTLLLAMDVLARIANLPLSRLPELLPWEWARRRDVVAIAA